MSKILLTYFSRPDENYNVGTVEVGNTALLAKKIATALAEQGITVEEFPIIPKTPYPQDYQSCIAQASAELKSGARPPLATAPPDLADFDTILLGYPIWWGDLPPVVYTFLDSVNLSGKTLVPFCTHEGSGQSGTFEKLAQLLPDTTILPGFACTGSSARQSSGQEKAVDWIANLSI